MTTEQMTANKDRRVAIMIGYWAGVDTAASDYRIVREQGLSPEAALSQILDCSPAAASKAIGDGESIESDSEMPEPD